MCAGWLTGLPTAILQSLAAACHTDPLTKQSPVQPSRSAPHAGGTKGRRCCTGAAAQAHKFVWEPGASARTAAPTPDHHAWASVQTFEAYHAASLLAAECIRHCCLLAEVKALSTDVPNSGPPLICSKSVRASGARARAIRAPYHVRVCVRRSRCASGGVAGLRLGRGGQPPGPSHRNLDHLRSLPPHRRCKRS